MKKNKFVVIFLLTLITINIVVFSSVNTNGKDYDNPEKVSSSSLGYSGLINKIYNKKLEQYGIKGYFPQVYEPSIQATYYALATLAAIGRLDDINTTHFTNYIMSFYNHNESVFVDRYAERWLDANYNREIVYPLASLLEINCYAVLTLEILGSLHLIDSLDMIDFIWDCYNPVIGGFIGMPFDVNLPAYLKDPTMDNTFYAAQVIELLDNWDLYNIAKNKISEFVSSLQLTMSDPKWFGGFYSSKGNISALMMLEPNLLSAYYNIKTLDILGELNAININNFHSYLNNVYELGTHSFHFSGFQSHTNDDELNIVGTALALELAELTSFSGYDKALCIEFVINNKNSWGIWDQSTNIHYHELIDTFQITRSLFNVNGLSVLVESEKNMIVTALDFYFNHGGYALLSEDYTSLRLINYLINSYDIFDRLSDLPISQLYLAIESCYSIDNNFIGSINMDFNAPMYRSFPLEYFSVGNQRIIYGIERMISQKNMFLALDSLNLISKLNIFELSYGLSGILNNIINSQFLEGNYTNYGGFLPNPSFKIRASSKYQNECVDFSDAYFAIRALELLANYMQLDNISAFAFDINALNYYILNQINETADEIYFTPRNIRNSELILEYTYYAVYILKTLGTYELDSTKIKNYVDINLNYTNLKNVYYSYQLSDFLNLSIYFDIPSIQALISEIYDNTLYEFYESTEEIAICYEGFYWVCSLEKYFTNPDYKDTNFFRDFSSEFIHTIILGGILIGIPSIVLLTTSKRIHFINLKKKVLSGKKPKL
ncbi:MAG: hypothetical protein ACFE8E_02840 [Candidatus Hodarchaeota archaeon]